MRLGRKMRRVTLILIRITEELVEIQIPWLHPRPSKLLQVASGSAFFINSLGDSYGQ